MTKSNSDTSERKTPPGLVYVSEDMPGYSRRKRGKGYEYIDHNDKSIKDEKEIERLNALAVPPAYTDVWICPKPNGHLQATGLDEKSRKQYRYHEKWSDYRSTLKFENLPDFAVLLPRIRRRISRELRESELNKDFVCAALVRLIDKGHLRIGSTRESVTGAVGAASLKHKNVKLDDGKVKLDYIAKGGKRVRRQLSDKTLMRTLEKIDNLPGKKLFQYYGTDGELYGLDSADVNEWLKSAAGDESVSAKTFRTWAGTLAAFGIAQKANDLTIKAMCEAAAEELQNTPSICRNSYVHPKVIDLSEMEDKKRAKIFDRDVETISGLTNLETRLLEFLRGST